MNRESYEKLLEWRQATLDWRRSAGKKEYRRKHPKKNRYKGVYLQPSGKYGAFIKWSGKKRYLGTFNDEIGAVKVYQEAREKLQSGREKSYYSSLTDFLSSLNRRDLNLGDGDA